MAARLGNVLYWLGTVIAVMSIGGAIIWNWVTWSENTRADKSFSAEIDAQLQLASKMSGRLKQLETGRLLGLLSAQADRELRKFSDAERGNVARRIMNEIDVSEFNQRLEDLAAWKRVAKEKRENSTIVGLAALLIGFLAYAVGWVARYILRGPSR